MLQLTGGRGRKLGGRRGARNWRWGCAVSVMVKWPNAMGRCCRLKDFRRVATRYDCNAMTFLAAVCIAAAVSYWLSVRTQVRRSRSSRSGS